jgi:hypothetical protein
MIRYTMGLCAVISLLSAPWQTVGAQGAQISGTERAFALAPGDTIQLLSRRVHEGGPGIRRPGRRLDLVYTTPIADAAARAAQADRAAQLFGAQAAEMGVHRLSIGICDTRECAERRHPPAQWFLYERTNDGWRRVK